MIRFLFIFLFPFCLLAQTWGPSDTARLNDPRYLQGYWRLAGDAKDYSGHGNHGTWSGTEAYQLGPFGKDVANNNGTGYIECSNTNALNLGTNFTLSIWCKVDALITPTAARGLIAKRLDDSSTTRGYSIYIYPVSSLNRIYFQAADGVNSRLSTSHLPFGKWTHLALSCGANGFFSYIDGRLINSNSVPFSTTDNTNKLMIGRIGSYTVTGKTANARVYSVGLSPAEVSALYALDSQPALPPISLEQPYDTLPDKYDSTLMGAWLNKATVGNANDYSLNARNGTATSVNWQKVGANFYTTTSKITASASDLIGTGDVTIMAVINPREWGGSGGSNIGRILDNSKFTFNVYPSRLVASSDGTATQVFSAVNSISLGTYFVVTVTRSAGLINFYINGVLSGTANQNAGTPTAGSPTYVGNNAANTRNFDGLIKDVRIYNRILSVAEIQRMTQEMLPDPNLLCWIQNGKDISRYNRTLTKYNVQTGNGPMKFNGSDSYISTPDFIGTNDFTFSCWFRANGTGENVFGRFFSNGKSELYFGSTINFSFTNTGEGVDAASAAITPLYPQWVLITITRYGGNVTYYKNGLQIGTPNMSAGSLSVATTLYIGNRAAFDRTFDGLLSDIRFYSGVKSADEIKMQYEGMKCYF